MAKKSNIIWYVAGIGVVILLISKSANAAASANMVSSDQLSQTAQFETFSPTAYPDGSTNGVQNYSIGYGHQIQPNESYLLTATISQDQAQQLLLQDMQSVVNYLNQTGITFTPGQFDALSDFGYNEGLSNLQNVIAAFQNNGPDAATAKMEQYVYWHPIPGGPAQLNPTLVNRRNAEIATFNS